MLEVANFHLHYFLRLLPVISSDVDSQNICQFLDGERLRGLPSSDRITFFVNFFNSCGPFYWLYTTFARTWMTVSAWLVCLPLIQTLFFFSIVLYFCCLISHGRVKWYHLVCPYRSDILVCLVDISLYHTCPYRLIYPFVLLYLFLIQQINWACYGNDVCYRV